MSGVGRRIATENHQGLAAGFGHLSQDVLHFHRLFPINLVSICFQKCPASLLWSSRDVLRRGCYDYLSMPCAVIGFHELEPFDSPTTQIILRRVRGSDELVRHAEDLCSHDDYRKLADEFV